MKKNEMLLNLILYITAEIELYRKICGNNLDLETCQNMAIITFRNFHGIE